MLGVTIIATSCTYTDYNIAIYKYITAVLKHIIVPCSKAYIKIATKTAAIFNRDVLLRHRFTCMGFTPQTMWSWISFSVWSSTASTKFNVATATGSKLILYTSIEDYVIIVYYEYTETSETFKVIILEYPRVPHKMKSLGSLFPSAVYLKAYHRQYSLIVHSSGS